VVTPFKFPLRENPPVSVVSDPKHEFVVVNFRLVTLTPLSPLDVNVVVNPKAGEPFGSVRFAVQLPLIALSFDPPQLLRMRAKTRKRTRDNCFIKTPLRVAAQYR
jgi:hypothetical protein